MLLLFLLLLALGMASVDAKPVPATQSTPRYRSAARKGNAHALERNEDSNYTLLQAFEWESAGDEDGTSFYQRFEKESERLGEIGITAAWLPPPTKGSSQQGNGYDIYDLYDLGEFQQKGSKDKGDRAGRATKWGTKEDYVSAIATAKKHGVVVYVDAVLNHKAGADFKEKFMATEVAENDRNKEISGLYEIEGWTGFNFPGRKGKYSEFEWSHEHFTGVDWDARGQKKSIFRIQGDNKTWSENVDGEKGSYDYLMFSDIDHAHPDVANDIKRWGEWVIQETGASGFRFDAIKHMDENFCQDFVNHVRGKLNNPDLFCVGEFWKDSLDALTGYLDRFDTQFSIFDTPLHFNFKEASDAAENFDLRKVFDGTLVQARPQDAVTLVDNHDTQPGQALESWVDPTFKPLAYALILFRGDGYPCVFAGDLYGIREPKMEPMSQLDDFIRIRKHFAYGPTRDYFDHPNCLGWVREGDDDHEGAAVVICNGTEEGSKRMQIPDGHAGEVWTDVLGWSQGEVTIGDDGWADFKCPARSVSVWVKKDARGRDAFGKQDC